MRVSPFILCIRGTLPESSSDFGITDDVESQKVRGVVPPIVSLGATPSSTILDRWALALPWERSERYSLKGSKAKFANNRYTRRSSRQSSPLCERRRDLKRSRFVRPQKELAFDDLC